MSDSPQKRRSPRRRRPILGQPHPMDAHVGGRLRLRRVLLGLSQEALGKVIGLTFQQVQKYERGVNRIGASRLWELSNVLGVPIQFFFAETTDETLARIKAIIPAAAVRPNRNPDEDNVMARRETSELTRSYYRITDIPLRRRLLELVKNVANADDDEESS
jgi:transcriptional regulator with XRE-family HTH domain